MTIISVSVIIGVGGKKRHVQKNNDIVFVVQKLKKKYQINIKL